MGAAQVATAMSSIAEGIQEIAAAIDDVGDLDKLIKVSYAFDRMGAAAVPVNTAVPAMMTGELVPAPPAPTMMAGGNVINENVRTLTTEATAAGDRAITVKAHITTTSIDDLANKLANTRPTAPPPARAPSTSAPAGGGGKRTVVLELNGRQLAKALADLDAEYNDLRAD